MYKLILVGLNDFSANFSSLESFSNHWGMPDLFISDIPSKTKYSKCNSIESRAIVFQINKKRSDDKHDCSRVTS